jgi:hypothetical protein
MEVPILGVLGKEPPKGGLGDILLPGGAVPRHEKVIGTSTWGRLVHDILLATLNAR